jgi:LemA protein
MMRRWLWIPAVLLLAGCGYNTIQRKDEAVTAARANIDTELARRNDLIPNLVAVVDEAANFEKQTFTQVAQARAGLTQARTQMAQALQSRAEPDALAQANSALTGNLRTFLSVAVEAYPTLQANQNFRGLQDELTETENRIAVARRDYNEAVQDYNSYIRTFPTVLTARVIGAQRRKPFQAPAGEEQAPKVQFGDQKPTQH